jgi:uncharacterized delta-60 repeat protein
MKIQINISRLFLFLLFASNNALSQNVPLDSSFGSNGIAASLVGNYSQGRAIIIQPNGKIVIGGTALVRLNSSGTYDSTFNLNGIVSSVLGGRIGSVYNNIIYGIALQPDGKIVIAGTTSASQFAVSRYETDGKIDSSFGVNGMVSTAFSNRIGLAYAVAIQSDGKIIAGGSIANSASSTSPQGVAIARYKTNGILDSTYGVDGRVIFSLNNSSNVQASIFAAGVALRSDDEMYVAISGIGQFAGALFKTNGSLDSTFDGDGIATAAVGAYIDHSVAIALQQDGKIVLAGTATGDIFSNSYPYFGLVRFNVNGTLDTSFNHTGKVKTNVNYDDFGMSVAIQQDGKIVVGGYGHTSRGYYALARYNIDGSLNIKATKDVTTESLGGIAYAMALDQNRIYLTGNSDRHVSGFPSFQHQITTVAYSQNLLTTLPLRLLHFDVALKGLLATCSWQTTEEVNTSHFVIQRSSDGRNFEMIGNVQAKGNALNNLYSYSDALSKAMCENCSFFYRLQMVDKDGNFTYSNIEKVKLNHLKLVTIAPNPAKDFIYVTGSNAKILNIFDNSGRLITKRKINTVNQSIDISTLPKGHYIIKVVDVHGNSQVEKLVVVQ